MKINSNLSPGDWQLLSAYLDDQLSDKEKRQVEERLQVNPEYQSTLIALRQTRQLLHALPSRRVPRNFTLSGQSAQKNNMPSFFAILRFSSVAVALLLVAVFALDLKQSPPLMTAVKTAEDVQPAAVALEADKVACRGTAHDHFLGSARTVDGRIR